MRAAASTCHTLSVIARFNRAIQYFALFVIHTGNAGYWMPRFRGA